MGERIFKGFGNSAEEGLRHEIETVTERNLIYINAIYLLVINTRILLEKKYRGLSGKYSLMACSLPDRNAIADILDIRPEALRCEPCRLEDSIPYSGKMSVSFSYGWLERNPEMGEKLQHFADRRGWRITFAEGSNGYNGFKPPSE